MTQRLNDGSFQNIFKGQLNKDDIKAGLKKGFLERSGTTNLLDQITETSTVVITNTATPGQYQITIDNNPFDPNVRKNRTAFWLRRVIQFFSGKSERNEKINRVLDAVDDYMREQKKEDIQKLQGQINKYDQLIQAKTGPLNEFVQLRDDLQKFHDQVEKNVLGTWAWTPAEKDTAAALESKMYKNPAGQLKEKQNRIIALNSLEKKIDNLNLELSPLKQIKATLEAELEKIAPSAPPPPVIESILKGSVAINVGKASIAQKVDTSPLFSMKARWNSIATKDAFYKECLCPSLKALSYLFTKDQPAANALYTKWVTELDNLGALWKASGSENKHIDDLFTDPSGIIDNVLPRVNQAINFISKLPINSTDFLKKLEKLDIPDQMDPIVLSNDEVTSLLNRYIAYPSATDLAVLFPKGSTMSRWPAECQFVAALLYLVQEHKLAEIMQNPVKKQETIDTLDGLLKVAPPEIVTTLAGAASSSLALSAALAAASTLIPKPTPHTEMLQGSLKNQTDPAAKQLVQDAIDFSKTPARKQFDDQYNDFQYNFMLDGVSAIRSKYSNDEIDLSTLIKLGVGMGTDQKDAMQKTKAYLENSDSNDAQLKDKLKQEATQAGGKVTMNTLKMLKVFSPTLTKNQNAAAILTTLDQAVLPELRKQPPIDLEKDPIQPRLQTVLAPMNKLA